MRTFAVIPNGLIAVVTQHLKAGGEIILDEPIDDAATRTSNLVAMLFSTAIYVIERQKLVSGFTAARTRTPIVLQDY